MIRGVAALLLLASSFGGCLDAAPSATPDPADMPASAGPQRQRILVMLERSAGHYRPGYASVGGEWQGGQRRLAARIARQAGLELESSWPMALIGVDCVMMAVPAGRAAEPASAAVARMPGVAWAQPVHLYRAQQATDRGHNDRLFEAQPSARSWQLASLHRLATGRGVSVAVIDSRIDAAHPDLRGQLRTAQDFVGGSQAPEAHGTAVAGIIAARADNGIGIAGIAPNARLLGLRACWERRGPAADTVCDTLGLARALIYAIEHHADIFNLSLTGPDDRLLGQLVELGIARGASIVAAFDAQRPGGGFPASAPGVIAVADEDVAFTRRGVYVAPGLDVPTTEPGGQWDLVSGNSFAAAHVSGLLAVLRELGLASPAERWLVSARPAGGPIKVCETLLRARLLRGAGCRPMR